MDINVAGRRVRRSTGTSDKALAQELHDKSRHELWRIRRMGERPRMSWQEATVRWMREKADSKRSIKDDRAKIKALDPHFRDKYLDEIDSEIVRDAIELPTRSGATLNRYVALIKAILRAASRDWETLDRVPKLPTYPDSQQRIRYVSRPQADRLVRELPEHLRHPTEFALQTGLRAENCLGLEWAHVNLINGTLHLPAAVMKGKKPLTVPLTRTAIQILEQQSGKHEKWVFVYRPRLKGGQLGEPRRLAQIKTETWQKACARAGIEDFHFHDLRHTWASWHVMNGTSLRELMELGGWSEYKIVLRYAHLAPQHLARVAGNIPAPLG